MDIFVMTICNCYHTMYIGICFPDILATWKYHVYLLTLQHMVLESYWYCPFDTFCSLETTSWFPFNFQLVVYVQLKLLVSLKQNNAQ